jgi:tRNA(fMet)-specific endonuclease VapC
MIYLLDTNVCIALLRGKDPLLLQRAKARKPADVALCSVVLAELYYGAALSNQPNIQNARIQAFIQPYRSLPFDDAAAELFGDIRAQLEKLGTPIGPYDMMIAAIGRANRLTVVMHNTSESTRVPGLSLEDWQIP